MATMLLNRRILSVFIGVCVGLPGPVVAQTGGPTCNISQGDLFVPSLSKPDTINKKPGDYYLLSLSWSPQFCTTPPGQSPKNKFQCRENSFGFVVHGFWPQAAHAQSVADHPRNCEQPTTVIAPKTLKDNLCTVPGIQLMQDEWAKHGTCAYKTPEAYFADIEKVVGALHIPDVGGMAAKGKKKLTAGALIQAFVAANPGLSAADMQLNLKGSTLVEVHVCYSKALKFQACEPGANANDTRPVTITPKK